VTSEYKPKRYFRSHRLKGFDYGTTAAYFVTICSFERYPFFSIPELAAFLDEQWNALPQRFPGITLDSFAIMPDHVHFIIWIDEEVAHAPKLPAIIMAFKSLTARAWLRHLRETKSNRSGKIWQKNYYDRVIRNKQELEKIRRYIKNNPTKK
jgi:putative transposase